MGFLPNGDLILVSLNNESQNYKIYSYSYTNKPATDTTLWECFQIYDIEATEGLKDEYINCFVCQTKLFLLNGCRLMSQWNLSTMTFDVQYFFDYEYIIPDDNKIVINNNHTLLALNGGDKIDILSMETGAHISRYG